MPKRKEVTKITFNLPKSLKAQIEIRAKQFNMGVSEYLRTLAVEDLQQ